MTKPISLGNTARDITTGIQGITTSFVEYLTGNTQFVVQPPTNDGVLAEAMGFDIQQLDYVDEGIVARVTPAPANTGIVLGSEVKDIVTGSFGIAVRKTIFINGCIYYTIAAPMDKEGMVKEDFIEYRRLEVISKGVIDKMAKKLEKETPEARKSGGPITRQMKRG